MTVLAKIARAARMVASWSSSLDPKCAIRPLLLISSSLASRPIESPSRPSTDATSTALREHDPTGLVAAADPAVGRGCSRLVMSGTA